MRIVSFVPSWTETLLEAGLNVVGRTRFCTYPQARIRNLPAVGGTKDWDVESVRKLKPDVLLLDREENPKWMSVQTEFPWIATHVTSIQDMSRELHTLGEKLASEDLHQLARRWEGELEEPVVEWNGGEVPGLMEWGHRPEKKLSKILYMIWREPWMAVNPNTFIGSMLGAWGMSGYLTTFAEKYPRLELSQFDPHTTLLLFSSEPYPFHKIQGQVKKHLSTVHSSVEFPHAFVDGRKWSWFGKTALEFLEQRPRSGSKVV